VTWAWNHTYVKGDIVMMLYRADTRTPAELIKAGGFKAWAYPNQTESAMRIIAIKTVKEMYSASGSKSELMSHIWGTPDKRFISTALTSDCMGQANKKNYRFDKVLFKRVEEYSKIYRIEIPNLKVYTFDSAHLGFPLRTIRDILKPKPYMDSTKLDTIKWAIALGQPVGKEVTFVTMIPLRFIKGYKEHGGSWTTFPRSIPSRAGRPRR
jgi:hypothetical protein